MPRGGPFSPLLVALCALLLVTGTYGVSSAARASNGRLQSITASAREQALESPHTTRATEPAPPPPDRNLGPDASVPEMPPAALAGPAARSPVTSQTSVTFPATGDTISVLHDPLWFATGDQAVGARAPGLNRVTGVQYNLTISPNSLVSPGQVDLDLTINSVVVGSFTVLPGEGSKTVSFVFPPVSGPSYTIRLRETNTVAPGSGSIGIPLDTSALTLYDSTASFPATGDTITVAHDPLWFTTGDQAVGARVSGVNRVTGVQYNLTISPNSLVSTGHVDFDLTINSVVVGSFTVLPGEGSKTVSFSFPPISGPSYIIRLRETNTVAFGLGSIGIPLDTSRLLLVDHVFLPLTTK